MEYRWNYNSKRAKTARFGHVFRKYAKLIVVFILLTMLIGGGYLLVLSYPFGWFVLGCASIPFVIYLWGEDELIHVPPLKNPKTVDGLLASEILGRMKSQNIDLKELGALSTKVASSQFFLVRFSISPNMVVSMAESLGNVTLEQVFEEADNLRKKYLRSEITGAMIMVAIILLHPSKEGILANVHITTDDLIAGFDWYYNIDKLIEEANKPKKTGGLARDWAFGYIPTLSMFGTNISDVGHQMMISTDFPSRSEIVDKMIDILSSNGTQNVALIGGHGSGKTAIVQSFADRLLDGNNKVPQNLKYHQVYVLDASRLISAASSRSNLETLIRRILIEANRAKNIILCLDNAQVFFEESAGTIDISNSIEQILETGAVRLILTMDEQKFLKISQNKPSLTNSLNRIKVAPTNFDDTMRILEDDIISIEYKRNITYTYQALKRSYDLASRYIYDIVMPGQASKLLKEAANYAVNQVVSEESIIKTVESTMNVKVGNASSVEEKEKLLHLEELIHQRMINQTKAVSAVANAIRRARSGVRNQNRPIGTFLFLGPTGVGKTELAKALSEIYFNGENNLIRIDLNEYVMAEDVNRLIASGAENPNSLTAQVMKNPFSVILLDEIEKAHPNVLTTLLQLLDEGILRDFNNREISFRDSIVIATSNAMADRIREYIERGYNLDQFEDKFVSELISNGDFKTEFLNRFDEIVIFRPLNQGELRQVIDLILKGVNKTLAPQHLSIEVDDDAKDFLVEKGYDPRLGARPMRRIVQKSVENIIAKKMLANEATPGSTLRITLEEVEASISDSPKFQ
ncbi:ATP-dependent Clp protease ATP-binding subunit [TM7 phylum sp. oral taxon 350]|nr:ATP-dependent Clp protease ATP-binding subunit [TM7 phylum sp. oral taxon 350]